MKNLKIRNKYLRLGVCILIFGFTLLLSSAPAQAVSPAKGVINPVTETIYVPDNSPPFGINIYSPVSSPIYWQENTASRINLEARSYGLAVWQEGAEGRLLISVNNGTSSKLRYYKLDAAGFPTGSPKDVNITEWGSSPTGVAILSTGDRAYLADAGNALIYCFDYNSAQDQWEQVGDYYDTLQSTIYDIALSPTPDGSSYKVFVSTKVAQGKVLAYDYNGSGLTPAGEISNLQYPTNMKVNSAGTQLYVAVNGASDGDIKVYDIDGLQPVGTISSTPGEYGWTGFNLDKNEEWLYYTQAETTRTVLYKVRLPISSDVTDPAFLKAVIKTDGLVCSPDRDVVAVTYSGYGNIEAVPSQYGNDDPFVDPMSPRQYKLDGETEIPAGGKTNQEQIVVKFTVSDPNPEDNSLIPIVKYHQRTATGWTTYEVERGEAVPNNSTATVTIPVESVFEYGEYEWAAACEDKRGMQSSAWSHFNGDVGVTDFVVGPNEAPNDFGKVAPPDAGQACCEVRLEWQDNGDPDQDALTYQIILSEVGGVDIAVPDTDSNTQTIPMGTLTVGKDYEWNVSASDGVETVWANGDEANKWTFTYIEGIVNPEPPEITVTSPVDGATDVSVTASIAITFSESMLKQSVEDALDIQPNINITQYSWNPTQTELTIYHDVFATETQYVVEVGSDATDLGGDNLVAGQVPNPFRFTTGRVGEVEVTNESVARDGDNPGDSITVSWQTIPAHSPVEIYYLERTADYVLTADEFHNSSNWTMVANPAIIPNGDLDTFTDLNQVGTGTQKYYTIVPQGQNVDPATNVVGKFDLTVGPEVEKLFVSAPVKPSDTSLNAVLGAQATDFDIAVVFNIQKEAEKGSMLQGGTWDILPGATAPMENIDLGQGFGYITQSTRYITLVGTVRETELSRTLTGNSTANWIAAPYPYSFGIANAGLNSSSYDANPVNAAMAVHFDANAEAIGGTDGIAFHYGDTEWREGTLQGPSPLILAPGKSHMLIEPGTNDVTWTINR